MPPERVHPLFIRRSSSQSRSLTQQSQVSQLSQILSQQTTKNGRTHMVFKYYNIDIGE